MQRTAPTKGRIADLRCDPNVPGRFPLELTFRQGRNLAPRAVREYPDTLDEAAFVAASEVKPKFTSFSDPASQWTAARKGPAFFSYSDNYLIDTDYGVILDVETMRSIRQAEVGPTKTFP
jgi:hypothetical protein